MTPFRRVAPWQNGQPATVWHDDRVKLHPQPLPYQYLEFSSVMAVLFTTYHCLKDTVTHVGVSSHMGPLKVSSRMEAEIQENGLSPLDSRGVISSFPKMYSFSWHFSSPSASIPLICGQLKCSRTVFWNYIFGSRLKRYQRFLGKVHKVADGLLLLVAVEPVISFGRRRSLSQFSCGEGAISLKCVS